MAQLTNFACAPSRTLTLFEATCAIDIIGGMVHYKNTCLSDVSHSTGLRETSRNCVLTLQVLAD